MNASVHFILLVPLAVIGSIFLIFNVWLLNIIIYGNMGGPCVWPFNDYIMIHGSVDGLVYDEWLQCYLRPDAFPYGAPVVALILGVVVHRVIRWCRSGRRA